MAKQRVDMRFDPDLLERIDIARGGEGRTAWVERACRAFLGRPVGEELAGTANYGHVTGDRPKEPELTEKRLETDLYGNPRVVSNLDVWKKRDG